MAAFFFMSPSEASLFLVSSQQTFRDKSRWHTLCQVKNWIWIVFQMYGQYLHLFICYSFSITTKDRGGGGWGLLFCLIFLGIRGNEMFFYIYIYKPSLTVNGTPPSLCLSCRREEWRMNTALSPAENHTAFLYRPIWVPGLIHLSVCFSQRRYHFSPNLSLYMANGVIF